MLSDMKRDFLTLVHALGWDTVQALVISFTLTAVCISPETALITVTPALLFNTDVLEAIKFHCTVLHIHKGKVAQ